MKYIYFDRESNEFDKYAIVCKQNIVTENLVNNGGTLYVPDAVFYSNVIIIAFDNEAVVGFVALNTKHKDDIYIYKSDCSQKFL